MEPQVSVQDLQDAQDTLAKLFANVREQESSLSGGRALGLGASAVQALQESAVVLGNPRNELIRLTPQLFKELGIELSELRKRQRRAGFEFYYMTLNVSMQPERGAKFDLIECRLDFGPKGDKEPIVQTYFPQRAWREVLSWGGKMSLALDANLDWRAGIDLTKLPQPLLDNLPGAVKAKLDNQNNLMAFVAVPEYTFKLGRPEIAATGEGNSFCFWRLEHPELQETQNVQFGIVFKVPRDRTQIQLRGLVVAEASMSWLTGQLRHIVRALDPWARDRLREKKPLAIGSHETWKLTLPQ